jgi:pimeloyl-ACP methyl ester carboxylesterase
MVSRARFLLSQGHTVLLFDFQAHGESPGAHITTGYLERLDARAAIDFVRAEAPGERVGVIGVSMGGAALALATPPSWVEAAVFEMVYPTIEQAIDDRLRMRLGAIGVVFRPLITAQLPLRFGVSAADLHPIDHVGAAAYPKLFIAGAQDMHTTIAESRELFEAAAAPKELWVVEGASHRTCTTSASRSTRIAWGSSWRIISGDLRLRMGRRRSRRANDARCCAGDPNHLNLNKKHAKRVPVGRFVVIANTSTKLESRYWRKRNS